MKDYKYNYNNQSGMYRERIEIQQLITTLDETLQEKEEYVSLGKFWAMTKTFTNREILREGSEKFENDRRFVIKYNKSLDEFIYSQTNTFIVIHKNITYNVREAINDNDLNQTITIRLNGLS